MKNENYKSMTSLLLGLTICCFYVETKAQTTNSKPVEVASPAVENGKQAPKQMTDAERQEQANKMKADREMNMKIGELNKQIQEAEKAGTADTPEVVAKKAELKKLQEERNMQMRAEREKMMKERAANPPAGQQDAMKINQLNKEIQEAEKAGKADTPEIVAKKAELKKLQEERNMKMKAEREKMMKERPMPTPEEIEANKKMGQLNKEIKDAEKEGKGDTPEVQAKKAELKKMQEARIAKMKADRESKAKEQAAPPVKTESVPVNGEKK